MFGQQLMTMMEQMTDQEINDYESYKKMMQKILSSDDNVREIHYLLMPYIDFLTYQHCVIYPKWIEFMDKNMPQSAKEYYGKMDNNMEYQDQSMKKGMKYGQ